MCTGAEAIAGVAAAASIAGTAASTVQSMKSAKTPGIDKPEAAPTLNDPAVGEAELKRKRASAGSFGRKSTIATSGMGVADKGVKLGVGG